jgi:hypothetical protein
MANIRMTAIQMIQEVATRLGITRPSTIEVLTGNVESIVDRDALIMLGALNQSIRSAAAAFTWRDMVVYKDVTATLSVDQEGKPLYHSITLDKECVGYDGMASSFVYFHYDEAEASKVILRQMSFDKFMLTRGDRRTDAPNYGDIYLDERYGNGYAIIGRTLETACPIMYNTLTNPYLIPEKIKCFISYKCSYPVIKQEGTPQMPEDRKILFTKDGDMPVIDDECVILGTLMNYKNYIGRDYQLEVKLFMDYIEHMKERNGGLTVIEENEYSSLIDRMHRYPPPSTLGQGGGGIPQKQQEQPQQQQGQRQQHRPQQQQQQGE